MTSMLILTDFPESLCSTPDYLYFLSHSCLDVEAVPARCWADGIVGSVQICLYSTSSSCGSMCITCEWGLSGLCNYCIWSHSSSLPRLSFFLSFDFLYSAATVTAILMLWFNSSFKCKFDNTSWKLRVADKETKLPCLCFERLHLSY